MSQTTVLVVDDDRANQESVARIFQREGLATLSAANGQEAVELLRRPEVAVVVTDLMMPGMDGQELLKAARTIRPDVEVVLMTAYATVETAVAAMKDGAYDFITKPLKRESGTGKELAARALHEHSHRAKGPFIAVNCAALPESILEAELFGVERGAFTGAVSRKEGRFERASGGTLFLDEVGEMSASAQVKLLRVLQEGEIERLGGTPNLRVDG